MSVVVTTRETRRREGSHGLPSRKSEDLSALGSFSSDLVESRIGKLKRLHLRSSVHHLRQGLQYLRISRAAVRFSILFRLPEADRYGFPAVTGNQGD